MPDGIPPGSLPLVSVVLTTRDRPRFLPIALACYQHQTYPRRELIVVDDGAAFPVEERIVAAAGGRLIRLDPGATLGAKLNQGAAAASGQFCQKMDDDDWYAPRFLETLVSALLASWQEICRPTLAFLMPFLFFDLARWQVRRSIGSNAPGATLLFGRDDWQERPFRGVRRDEDVWFVLDQAREGIKLLPVRAPELYLAVRHRGGGRDRGHTWTHQWDGQILEEYVAGRPLHEGGPEGLLPDWALGHYRELRRDWVTAHTGGAPAPGAGAPGPATDDADPRQASPGEPRIAFRMLALKDGSTFQIAFDRRATDEISVGVAGDHPWYLNDYAVLLDAMKPGDTVLDLGGHIGTFSLAAAALGCNVVCVEAAPANVALLRASVDRNGFDRMRVIHAAVIDHDGTIEFIPNGPWGAVANPSVLRSPALISAERAAIVTVAARTVDAILDELGWDHVDYLKMDIEGSELSAIAGMHRLLSRSDAPLVLYESNGHALRFFDRTPADLTAALEGFGYQSYFLESRRLVPRCAGDLHIQGVVNCLAAKGPPPALRGWSVLAPPTDTDTVRRIIGQCLHVRAQHRAHVARELAGADARWRSDPQVRYALRLLRADADEGVRSAAAWSDEAATADAHSGGCAADRTGADREQR